VEGRLINVRRLVSLDITLHGERFILAEFGIGTPVILAVGLYLAAVGPLLLGLYLFLTGINYVPLLGYAIVTVRHHAHGWTSNRKWDGTFTTSESTRFSRF
jgi:hypothetical protein